MFSISEHEKLIWLSNDYTLNVKFQAESTKMFCVHEENIYLFAKTIKVILHLLLFTFEKLPSPTNYIKNACSSGFGSKIE